MLCSLGNWKGKRHGAVGDGVEKKMAELMDSEDTLFILYIMRSSDVQERALFLSLKQAKRHVLGNKRGY